MLEKLLSSRPSLAPLTVWSSYETLEETISKPKTQLVALVSLLRIVTGMDTKLTDFSKTVDKNFQQWILKMNAGQHNRFTEDQMRWLRMIKDFIATSYNIEKDDFDLSPFNAQGELSKMWQLFSANTEKIIAELSQELAA